MQMKIHFSFLLKKILYQVRNLLSLSKFKSSCWCCGNKSIYLETFSQYQQKRFLDLCLMLKGADSCELVLNQKIMDWWWILFINGLFCHWFKVCLPTQKACERDKTVGWIAFKFDLLTVLYIFIKIFSSKQGLTLSYLNVAIKIVTVYP